MGAVVEVPVEGVVVPGVVEVVDEVDVDEVDVDEVDVDVPLGVDVDEFPSGVVVVVCVVVVCGVDVEGSSPVSLSSSVPSHPTRSSAIDPALKILSMLSPASRVCIANQRYNSQSSSSSLDESTK